MSQDDSVRRKYDWLVLQEGSLPARPGRRFDTEAEHRCTSVLVWPEGAALSPENTIVTDPCFTDEGCVRAGSLLAALGVSWSDLGRFYLTHPHHDHCPCLPDLAEPIDLAPFEPVADGPLADMATVPCPGHYPTLAALVFPSVFGDRVWIVGDAVLDEPWLRAWEYYWLNGYSQSAIIETWQSLAVIFSDADLIVPGHGPPIRVTKPLLEDLLESFPAAEHAGRCPEVAEAIRRRLERLSAQGAAEESSR